MIRHRHDRPREHGGSTSPTSPSSSALAAGGVMMVIPAYLYHQREDARRRHRRRAARHRGHRHVPALCHRRPGPTRAVLAHDARASGRFQLADLDAHVGRDRPQRLPAASTCTSAGTCSTPAFSGADAAHPLVLPADRVPLGRSGRSRSTPSPRSSTAGWVAGRSGTAALLAPRFLASCLRRGAGVHHRHDVSRWRRSAGIDSRLCPISTLRRSRRWCRSSVSPSSSTCSWSCPKLFTEFYTGGVAHRLGPEYLFFGLHGQERAGPLDLDRRSR